MVKNNQLEKENTPVLKNRIAILRKIQQLVYISDLVSKNKLLQKIVGYNAEFAKVFPRETKEQDKAFKLLKKAYIETRHKKDCKITKVKPEYLAGCVRKL